MKPQIAEQLAAALLSGEYKQARNVLRFDPKLHNGEGAPEYKHCCLGVLCDLYSKVDGRSGKWQKGHPYDGSVGFQTTGGDVQYSYPPEVVLDWAGMNKAEARVLAHANDAHQMPFEEIANLVLLSAHGALDDLAPEFSNLSLSSKLGKEG
jgi:hypothetical protein